MQITGQQSESFQITGSATKPTLQAKNANGKFKDLDELKMEELDPEGFVTLTVANTLGSSTDSQDMTFGIGHPSTGVTDNVQLQPQGTWQLDLSASSQSVSGLAVSGTSSSPKVATQNLRYYAKSDGSDEKFEYQDSDGKWQTLSSTTSLPSFQTLVISNDGDAPMSVTATAVVPSTQTLTVAIQAPSADSEKILSLTVVPTAGGQTHDPTLILKTAKGQGDAPP